MPPGNFDIDIVTVPVADPCFRTSIEEPTADNIAQGFGGTVLIAYLSSLTNRDFTATQYALLSSFMALFPKFLAGYSGNVQEALGWLGFFLYAALLGVPAIIVAFVVARRHDSLVDNKTA